MFAHAGAVMVRGGAGPTTSVFVHQGFSFPVVIPDSKIRLSRLTRADAFMVTQEATGLTYKEVVDQVVPFLLL